MPFRDRVDAGRALGERLLPLRGRDLVVLGLPRGGVPVAAEVARILGAPLDVVVVRKLGVPSQPELAMGAIGEDGVCIVNEDVTVAAGIPSEVLAEVERRERAELDRRLQQFRAGRRRAPLHGRTAIVVDDGIATGSTARAACEVVRRLGATRVVLAVPVAPASSVAELRSVADEVVCVETPPRFQAVGQWYDDFSQTTDDEVTALLQRAADEEAEVVVGPLGLPGKLTLPTGAVGVVLFAHGSGSSRRSPRNRAVAAVLHQAGLATLLFDLLSADEEGDRGKVFDIPLLGGRLADATRWSAARPEMQGLPVAYFGAGTGAGAALWAAAEPDLDIAALVSRGGRPDLAAERLGDVRAPTLLLVGERDEVVLDLNRQAAGRLAGEHRVDVVPGAGHLFEEPGALQAVAEAARDWFLSHLGPHAEKGRTTLGGRLPAG